MAAYPHIMTRLSARRRILLLPLLILYTLTAYSQKLTEYLPSAPTDVAVIVCPGGSYCWLSKKTEGSEVAKWLNSQGFAAYVLEYPTAGWAAYAWHTRWFYRGHQYPDQLESLTQALKKVHEKGYKTVGLMGFSAGGHLVINAAEDCQEDIRPDFVAGLYPVITMNPPAVHRRSRRGLLGEKRWRDPVMRDSLSLERHADRITCPVFLANCADDPIVPKHNAELMDSALTAHGKPHLFVQYKTGGHGFGVDATKTSAEAIKWTDKFLFFLHKFVFKGNNK